MDTVTAIPPHTNPTVRAFLVRLRGIARGPSNPAGIIAETLALNLGTRTPTLRAWLQGVSAPSPLAVETLQKRLDKICSVADSVPDPASPAGLHPSSRRAAKHLKA